VVLITGVLLFLIRAWRNHEWPFMSADTD